VTISHAAVIEWCGRIEEKEAVHCLESLHVLDASVIEERFVYDTKSASLGGKGIHIAFVRIYRLEPPTTLPMEKGFGGCRSWIELPEVDLGAMVSVLSDEEHRRRRDLFASLLKISF